MSGIVAVHCRSWKELSPEVNAWKIFAGVTIRSGWTNAVMNIDMTM
ncbi:hypothetical protein [Micromonospora sp. NPDC050495]